MCTLAQTWPKKLVLLWQSQLCVDVIQSGIFAQNGPFSLHEKGPFHDILWMWRTHLEDISSCLSQGLADSTMELIDSRCVGAQWNSKRALLLFIPFKTGIKQMSDSTMFQAKQISWLLWRTWLWFYYHSGFFFLDQNPSLVYIHTWYSKNVILVFLMTKVVCVSRLWALCERLLLM